MKKVIKREEPTCNSHSTTILNLDEQEQNSDWIKIAHRKRGVNWSGFRCWYRVGSRLTHPKENRHE